MRKALVCGVIGGLLCMAALVACGGEAPTPAAPTENTAPGSLPSADVDGGAAKK